MPTSDKRRQKKVVLVTGASSGIGLETAKLLVESGHIIYGTSRTVTDYVSTPVNMVAMDVTDRISIESCVHEIIDKEKRIDVLINCAGAGISGPLEEISEDEMLWQMNVNFFGALRVIQAVLPGMREKGKGLIININSLGGKIGLPYQGMYSASKFGLDGLTEALEKELKPFGVKVVSVMPGDIATPFTENRILNGRNNEYSPYFNQAKRTLRVIEKDERGGMDPIKVGKVIDKIVNSKKPRHRYIVAAWDQRLAVKLKSILPHSLFSNIISDHYDVN